jgi:D-glycero-D-manno-heptose 1,7-bisphosphate phosphatase
MSERRRAIFLDRDNTLVWDPGYLHNPAQVRLLPGVVAGLQRFRQASFQLIVISNQAGIGRGYFTFADLARVEARLVELLATHDLVLDGFYYCPHAPWEACQCRKPAPGMLISAATDHGIDLSASWMIGDKPSDVAAGRQAGCGTVQLGTERGATALELPDYYATDLADAAGWIEARTTPP